MYTVNDITIEQFDPSKFHGLEKVSYKLSETTFNCSRGHDITKYGDDLLSTSPLLGLTKRPKLTARKRKLPSNFERFLKQFDTYMENYAEDKQGLIDSIYKQREQQMAEIDNIYKRRLAKNPNYKGYPKYNNTIKLPYYLLEVGQAAEALANYARLKLIVDNSTDIEAITEAVLMMANRLF